jgi:hypothetical protein
VQTCRSIDAAIRVWLAGTRVSAAKAMRSPTDQQANVYGPKSNYTNARSEGRINQLEVTIGSPGRKCRSNGSID